MARGPPPREPRRTRGWPCRRGPDRHPRGSPRPRTQHIHRGEPHPPPRTPASRSSARVGRRVWASPWRPEGSSGERLLDRREHRLPVGVPALVVANLPQLRRRQVPEPVLHLPRSHVVIAPDRERGPDRDAASGPVGAADDPVDRLRRTGAAGGRVPPLASLPEEPLQVGEELIGLVAPETNELGAELGGVGPCEPPALGGVVERLLDPLLAEDDKPERLDDPVDQLLGEAGKTVGPASAGLGGSVIAGRTGATRRRLRCSHAHYLLKPRSYVPSVAEAVLGVARSAGATSISSSAFWACRRFSAWSHTRWRGPYRTSEVISSPGCAGRQWSAIAPGAARSSRPSSRR